MQTLFLKIEKIFKKNTVSSYLIIWTMEDKSIELTFDTFYKEGYNNKSRDLYRIQTYKMGGVL